MTTRFDETRVRRVAALARLTLSPEEEATFARELDDVCAAFEALPAAAESPADAESEAAPAVREDAITQADDATRAAIVAAFPRKDGHLARVPRGL